MADESEELERRSAAFHAARDASDEALTVHRRLVDRKPTDRPAANRLGAVLHRRGQLDDALAVYRDALVADRDNTIAAGRIRTLEGELARRARRSSQSDFVRRPPDVIVDQILHGPGRVASLRLMARSIRRIQQLDHERLSVNDVPSDHTFRVVGGIFSGIVPWGELLCVSIDRAVGAPATAAVEAAGGRVTHRPEVDAALPRTIQIGIPFERVDEFADAVWEAHVEHLKVSIAYGPPTWRHRHDEALTDYILSAAAA